MELAEGLLTDIELSRIGAPDIVRKASRLARLLDDVDASAWLRLEVEGYDAAGGGLDSQEAAAARRSRRGYVDEDSGNNMFRIDSVSSLVAVVDASRLQLASAADAPVSITSANPYQNVTAPGGNNRERYALRESIATKEAVLGNILGAIYGYVADKQIELRFGTAVEGAFSVVRGAVDAQIAEIVPEAAVKFAAAFENASSDNPEHWANAAFACRRLLKSLADALRPPGPPVNNRKMTDDNYINRLIDWISTRPGLSSTLSAVMTADLEDFGKRIDAFDNAGHKGAHSEVTKVDASRFIAGTYLLVGDVLRLSGPAEPASEAEAVAEDEDAPA